MPDTLRIARRFNGPNNSGNGGYSAGLAARELGGGESEAIEATLRAAIPLDRTLRIERREDGLDVLTDDASDRILVMQLRRRDLARPAIHPPSLKAAEAASAHYDVEGHVLPRCFVCGPARAPGDGLRIFPHAVGASANPNPIPIAAASWTPGSDLAGEDGRVGPEFVWAALDCPGAFALDAEPILLGRMAARILDRPRAGDAHMLVAWPMGQDRRKHFAGTALFTAQGELLAFSQQTWISIEAHAPPEGEG
jgi:hypothetical protein